MKQMTSQDLTQTNQTAAPEPSPSVDQVVEAIFQDGVFKPVKPLNLPAGTRMQLTVPRAGTSGKPLTGAVKIDEPDFDRRDNFAATKPAATTPPLYRTPLFWIAIAVAVAALLGYFALRHRNTGGAASATSSLASGGTTAVKPPVMADASAQLAPLQMVTEIKLAGVPENKAGAARSVAVDAQGNIYVASTAEGLIRKYDQNGKLLLTFGNTAGGGEPVFNDLFAIAIGPDNKVYALDTVKAAILHFDAQGNRLGEVASVIGYAPHGFSIAPNGDFLVAVTGSNNVVRLSPKGERLAEIGKSGQGADEFDEPTDAVVTNNGEMYVFDGRNRRIQHLAANGSLINEWGTEEVAARDSGHLALDKQGRLFVTAPLEKELLAMNPKGEIIGKWSQADVGGPTGITIDSQNNLYMAYPQVNIVRKFRLPQ